MKSMQEIINRFVDGEVRSHGEAMKLVMEESAPFAEEQGEDRLAVAAAFAASIANTATRLCPSSQAERIIGLLKSEPAEGEKRI